MDSTNMCNLQTFGQSTMGQNQQVYEYSRLNLVSVSREQSVAIMFETKEGDQVTLSADSSIEAAYATYDSKAQIKGAHTESKGQLNSVTAERKFTINVEGDLSDQEKKEIKKLLGKIFKMMKNFLSGQIDSPGISTVKDIQLDTLANVEAKYEVKKSVLEVDHTSAEHETDLSTPVRESDGDSKPMARLIDRMVAALNHSRVEHDRFLKFFGHRPSRLSDEYIEQEPDAWKMRKLARMISTGLFHQLENILNIAKESSQSDNPANEDAIPETEAV